MIGVFDSGFGGLSILKKLIHKLPKYSYIYLGDNARTPYGDKTKKQLLHHTKQVIRWFRKQKVPLVIFACNTASAVTLRALQKTEVDGKKYPIRVLGVIRPLVEEIKKENAYIGVIATKATVKSGAITREIRKLHPSAKVKNKATPGLVPLIEKNLHHTKKMQEEIKKNLKTFTRKKLDAFILGSTHYEHIRPEIQKVLGKKVHIINQADIVAEKLKDYLLRHPEIEVLCEKKQKRTFYTTTAKELFWSVGRKMVIMDKKKIHHLAVLP